MSDLYGIDITIKSNVPEVKSGLVEIKKILDTLNGTKYALNIDTSSLKNLKSTIDSISTSLANNFSQTAMSTTKFITDMNKSLSSSLKGLQGKVGYEKEIKEIQTLQSTLQKYANSRTQLTAQEMGQIKGIADAMANLSKTAETSASAQVAGTEKVSNAYSKLATLIKQIDNIKTKNDNYITKTGADATAIQSTITSLDSYKDKITQLMSNQTQLGNLTVAEYQKMILAINNAKNAVTQFQTANNANTKLVKDVEKQTQAVNKLEEAHKKLSSSMSSATAQQKQDYNALGQTITNLKASLSNVSNMADLNRLSTQVKTVDNSFKQLKISVNENKQAMSGMNDILSRTMSYFTGRLMYEASAFVTRGIRDMISSTLEMNEAITEMAMVQSKSINSVREDFRIYNELAKELKVSTEDISSAMITFVRQGLDTETAMNRVTVATQFAKAAAIDFNTAAELLTAGFNALGDGIKDRFRLISDVLLEIGRNAGTSAEEIATAMQKSASLAAQSGVELNELAAMLATVSERTRTSAETIGTSFSSMMSRFSNMTLTGFDDEGNSVNNVIKALKEVNIEVKDTNGWKSYSQILSEVGGVWKDLKKDVEAGGEAASIAQDKMNLIATQLAGTRQKNAFVGLMDNFDRYLELIEVADGATGTTLESYDIYLNSTEAAINSFKASWESLKLSFSESEFLDNVISSAGKLMDIIAKSPTLSLSAVMGIASLTKGISSLANACKQAALDAIKQNQAIAGASQGQRAVAGITAGMNGFSMATVAATAKVVLFQAALTMGITLAITLLTSLVIKMLDTERATRELNEAMLDLKNASQEANDISLLDEYYRKSKDINTTVEERLNLEEQVANLKTQISESDEEYKAILDNENLSLETRISLLKTIAKQREEELALEAKDAYLKDKQNTGFDVLLQKGKDFKDLYEKRLELAEKIQTIESRPYDSGLKASILKDDIADLEKIDNELREIGATILSVDSKARTINNSLSETEKQLYTLDGDSLSYLEKALKSIDAVAVDSGKSILETSSAVNTLTDSTEEYVSAAEKAERATQNFLDVFGGATDKSDFLQDIMDEYEEYGSLSYDTINKMVNQHSDLLYLLEDEENFMKNAGEAQVKANEEAQMSYEELMEAIKNGTIEIEEYIDKPYESILEGTGLLESEATPSVDNFTNNASNKMAAFGGTVMDAENKIRNLVNSIVLLNNTPVKIPSTNASGLLSGFTGSTSAETSAGASSRSVSEGGGESGVSTASMTSNEPAVATYSDSTMFANAMETRGIVSIRPNYSSNKKPSSSSSSSSSSSTGKKPSSSSSSSSSKANSKSTKQTVEDLELTIEKFFTLNQQIDNVNLAIERYQILAENANPKDRLVYMQKEIDMYNEKKALLIDLYNAQQKELASMKKKLTAQGFIIDNNGVIKNYETQLNKLQANANKLSGTAKENAKEKAEEIADLVKEFESLNKELQSTNNSIAEMENTIYSALKNQVQLIADMESKVTEILRKQIEERKQLIEDEKNSKIEAINEMKEAYNKQIEEETSEENLKNEKDKLLDIQAQIDKISKDTSLQGKKRLQELLSQYAEQEKVIADIIKQHEIDKNNEMFDAEIERLEKEAEEAKEKLDKEFSDEKIYQIAQEAILNGVFKDVYGNMVSVKDAFIEFEDKFGEGLTTMGAILKQELVYNLETATGLIKELDSILKNMGVTNLTSSSNIFGNNSRMSVATPTALASAYALEFNAPLINIEGNVDKNTLNDINTMAEDIKNTIYDEIAEELRIRGV